MPPGQTSSNVKWSVYREYSGNLQAARQQEKDLMSERHRLLLERAGLLYDKYEAGRPKPFNIFSVLHMQRDEVNLHSRFLCALLDHNKPRDVTNENLLDFLRQAGVEGFEVGDLQGVERERNNIDILITTRDRQSAVVVENKIDAAEQERQLCRYYNRTKAEGYRNVHVLYLTLYGDDPSDTSFCGIGCEARLHCKAISYRDTLPSWLQRCQMRAYDEPTLRESVAQYRHLIRELTGTDYEEGYMDELKNLLLEKRSGDNQNLLVAHDLIEAMTEAKIDLLHRLWGDVDAGLKAAIADLPVNDPAFEPNYNVTAERVRHFFTGNKDLFHALFYPFAPGAALAVEAGSGKGLIFGVYCYRQTYPAMHHHLLNATANVPGGRKSAHWPWYREADGLNLKNPTRENLRLLLDQTSREKYAQGIAQGLAPVWEAVKNAGLAA